MYIKLYTHVHVHVYNTNLCVHIYLQELMEYIVMYLLLISYATETRTIVQTSPLHKASAVAMTASSSMGLREQVE